MLQRTLAHLLETSDLAVSEQDDDASYYNADEDDATDEDDEDGEDGEDGDEDSGMTEAEEAPSGRALFQSQAVVSGQR